MWFNRTCFAHVRLRALVCCHVADPDARESSLKSFKSQDQTIPPLFPPSPVSRRSDGVFSLQLSSSARGVPHFRIGFKENHRNPSRQHGGVMMWRLGDTCAVTPAGEEDSGEL